MEGFDINNIDQNDVKTHAIYHYLKVGSTVEWNGILYFRNNGLLPYVSTIGTVVSRADDKIVVNNVKIVCYGADEILSSATTLMKYDREKIFNLPWREIEAFEK